MAVFSTGWEREKEYLKMANSLEGENNELLPPFIVVSWLNLMWLAAYLLLFFFIVIIALTLLRNCRVFFLLFFCFLVFFLFV